MSTSASPIPSELLTLKSLKTLSGASITVWVVCLVLSSLLPEQTLQYWHYRIIAFVLSVLITLTIIQSKKTTTKLAYGLLVLGNTCYIFINASGINSISKNQLFSKSAETISDSSQKHEGAFHQKRNNTAMAGLFPFLREADWWPDKEVIRENTILKNELLTLKNTTVVFTEKDSLVKKISVLEEQLVRLTNGTPFNEKKLIAENARLASQVSALTEALNQEKNKNAGLSQSLVTANRDHQDCLTKYNQLVKDGKKPGNSNLESQLTDAKAEVATLTNSLNACNQKYENCLSKYNQLLKDCKKADNTSLENQLASLKTEVATLTNSLNTCNQKYKDCIVKNEQLLKDGSNKTDCAALTKQVSSLKADIAELTGSLNNERAKTGNLTKSLTACEQDYRECLNSKNDKSLAENYKNCLANYQRTQRALLLARDSVNSCYKRIMKLPGSKID